MTGNRLALNLGPRLATSTSRLTLNLGVAWEDEPPVEPPLRGVWQSGALPWRRHAAAMAASRAPGWGRSPLRAAARDLRWSRAAQRQSATGIAWGRLPSRARSGAIAWSAAGRTGRGAGAPWRSLPRHARGLLARWAEVRRQASRGLSGPWRTADRHQRSLSGGWWSGLGQRQRRLEGGWNSGTRRQSHARMPWGPPRLAPWRVLPRPDPPVPPQPPSPFPPGNRVGLNLGCPPASGIGIAPLNLGVTACYAVRPHRRVYVVQNAMEVVRLPDRLPIEAESISISSSVGAFGWDLDMALLRAEDLAALQPGAGGPAEIEVTLNGYVWTFLVEDHTRTRAWAEGQGIAFMASIKGRSRTALLASPYAPLRAAVSTLARQAHQLVDAELEFTDFTAQYDAINWIVPAGAWYYDGLAPLDAIAKVATASGAVVLSDPADKVVRVVPRYPISPWDWTTSTPAVTVSDDVVLSDSLSVRSAPVYDAVVVTGELDGKGVLVRATREGEAGTLYAPQATDPLINTVAVATERARNILSDRGSQAAIEMTLPLFPAAAIGVPGRVLPLDLVEKQEAAGNWMGLATAVRIDATRTDGALLIDQTVTLERHYHDAN